jgi:hypothetical protein
MAGRDIDANSVQDADVLIVRSRTKVNQALFLLEFAFCQTLMSVVTAIFVFVLILKSYQIKFGSYD